MRRFLACLLLLNCGLIVIAWNFTDNRTMSGLMSNEKASGILGGNPGCYRDTNPFACDPPTNTPACDETDCVPTGGSPAYLCPTGTLGTSSANQTSYVNVVSITSGIGWASYSSYMVYCAKRIECGGGENQTVCSAVYENGTLVKRVCINKVPTTYKLVNGFNSSRVDQFVQCAVDN